MDCKKRGLLFVQGLATVQLPDVIAATHAFEARAASDRLFRWFAVTEVPFVILQKGAF